MRLINTSDNSKNSAILYGDPLQGKTVDEIRKKAGEVESAQELVSIYAHVYNKSWYLQDDIYDYQPGTEEYKKACIYAGEWMKLSNWLEEKVIEKAKSEKLFSDPQPNTGLIKQIEPFMKKYGYEDGSGWWVRTNAE